MGKLPRRKARALLDAGLISYEEYLVLKEDARFSTAIVIAAVVMITLYAAVMCQFTYLNIVNHTGVYPPMEFTTGYFAFWTVEIVMLASMKKHNIRNKHERDETDPLASRIFSEIQGRISPGGTEKAEPGKETEEGEEDAVTLANLL